MPLVSKEGKQAGWMVSDWGTCVVGFISFKLRTRKSQLVQLNPRMQRAYLAVPLFGILSRFISGGDGLRWGCRVRAEKGVAMTLERSLKCTTSYSAPAGVCSSPQVNAFKDSPLRCRTVPPLPLPAVPPVAPLSRSVPRPTDVLPSSPFICPANQQQLLVPLVPPLWLRSLPPWRPL